MSPDTHPGRTVIAPLTLDQRNAIRLAEFLTTKKRISTGEKLTPSEYQTYLERALNENHCTDAELAREKRNGY